MNESYARMYQSWPSTVNKVMFIIVMEHEAKDFVSLIGLKVDESMVSPFCRSFIGEYAGREVIVVIPTVDPVYGVQSCGTEPAVLCMQVAITFYHPDIVISAGTSGGVRNEDLNLRIGDILTPTAISFFNRSIIIKEWASYAKGQMYSLLDPVPLAKHLSLKSGVIGTDNSFTSENTDAKLAKIDCIEMEAAAEMRVAHILSTPFTAIKIISDVEMEDPKERAALFTEFFTIGIKALAHKLKEFLEKLDAIIKPQ